MRKGFDDQISVIRILDSRRKGFHLSKAYEHKIDVINVINVINAPEIEMLIIHNEGAYDRFKRSRKKPSEFCKTDLHMHDVKSYDFVKNYFSNPQTLVNAIREYRRTANIRNGEYSLSDLIRELPSKDSLISIFRKANFIFEKCYHKNYPLTCQIEIRQHTPLTDNPQCS